MKRWDQLKVGDYIYYYDHQKIHKQLVNRIETKTVKKKLYLFDDELTPLTYPVEYLYIHAGKNTVLCINKEVIQNLWDVYNEHSIQYKNMPRFCNEEDAQAYMEKLISIRKRRVEKYEKKYLKEKKILDSYCLEI